MLEPTEVGFGIRVSYLKRLDNLSIPKSERLPLRVVERYREEAGDSVCMTPAGVAMLVRGDNESGDLGHRSLSSDAMVVYKDMYDKDEATVEPPGQSEILAMARNIMRGQPVSLKKKALIGIMFRKLQDISDPGDEQLLAELLKDGLATRYQHVCPVTGCQKGYKNRDDLVKHIRAPSDTLNETERRLHQELDAKYQGLELRCCRQMHKAFGALVKHMKSHYGA